MQAVSPQFNTLANGDIRPNTWGTQISFTKAYDDDVTFFTYDVSEYDGPDVYAPVNDNPLQAWDKYAYTAFGERVIDMSVTREFTFSYSIVSAIADFTLNNYDKYFTPHSTSPIEGYILPKRPVRLFQGLDGENLQQFVGLTQGMPEIDERSATASFTAMDFLAQIYEMPIRETQAMRDVRTDEVLADIFTQFGLAPSQYDLSKGRNVIKFLFFEKEQLTAGDVIRPLIQAEGGALWLGEDGIIRFRPRLEQPTSPVYWFDEDSIVSATVTDEDQLINSVIINTDVREVQEWQTVYSKKTTDSSLNVIPAFSTYVYQADLQDPLLDAIPPVFGENAGVSWFTAALPGGEPVLSGVSVVSTEMKTNTYEITIANNNGVSVNIDQMSIWGQPAKKISVEPIIYRNKDQDSVDKYEEQVLEISNNFIQSVDAARAFAYTILDEYSEYADIVEFEVKGNAALQLSDIIDVNYKHFTNQYRIIAIRNKLQGSKFTQILKCRRQSERVWFQYDVSEYDGTDVYAP